MPLDAKRAPRLTMRAIGLADLLGAKPHELIFTSGGTEANNLAILGLARSRTARGKHLISAKTEHHAVLNTIEHLEKREGFEVTWLNVSQAGQIDLDQLADTIRDDTVLVSIMHANNETGVIQPLREISEICRERGVLLHSDMVQSFGKLAVIPSGVEGSGGEGFTITQRNPSTSLCSGAGWRFVSRCRQFCRAQILRSQGRRLFVFAQRNSD